MVLVTEHRILDSGNRKGHIVIRVRLIALMRRGGGCNEWAAMYNGSDFRN